MADCLSGGCCPKGSVTGGVKGATDIVPPVAVINQMMDSIQTSGKPQVAGTPNTTERNR